VQYTEYLPPLALRPWLECLWERIGDGAAPVRVLPDGCIDVVWSSVNGAWIVGPNTTAFRSPVAPGERVVGARLRPGGAPALLSVHAELVRDERPRVDQVLGGAGAGLAEALDVATNPVAALTAWLQRRVEVARRPDPVVSETARRLQAGSVSIVRLAGELGVSDRALRRRVRAAVGYGPKRLDRVLRLRRALAAARAGEELGRVAFDAGYADQAHFCGDCRDLAGVPPSLLLAE
jgi:AraC-like DNA-binding protein